MFWYWFYWQVSCHMETSFILNNQTDTLWDMIPTDPFADCVEMEMKDEEDSD